jgi:hypothetical protein
VIEDQKIVVGRTTTTKCARKSQAKKPTSKSLFNIEMMTTWMTCESLKRGREEVKSCFSFFLFQISFINFDFFYFIKCKGEQKQICGAKGEKKLVDLGVREKIQMQMVKERQKR